MIYLQIALLLQKLNLKCLTKNIFFWNKNYKNQFTVLLTVLLWYSYLKSNISDLLFEVWYPCDADISNFFEDSFVKKANHSIEIDYVFQKCIQGSFAIYLQLRSPKSSPTINYIILTSIVFFPSANLYTILIC